MNGLTARFIEATKAAPDPKRAGAADTEAALRVIEERAALRLEQTDARSISWLKDRGLLVWNETLKLWVLK